MSDALRGALVLVELGLLAALWFGPRRWRLLAAVVLAVVINIRAVAGFYLRPVSPFGWWTLGLVSGATVVVVLPDVRAWLEHRRLRRDARS